MKMSLLSGSKKTMPFSQTAVIRTCGTPQWGRGQKTPALPVGRGPTTQQ